MTVPGEAQRITIWLTSDDPTERERLEEELQGLADELREVSGVASVERVTTPPPPGTRVGEVIADGAMVLLVYLYGVRPVAGVIQGWLRRHEKKRLSIEEREDGTLHAAFSGSEAKTSIELADRLVIRKEPLPSDGDDATG